MNNGLFLLPPLGGLKVRGKPQEVDEGKNNLF